jgi:protein-tyrosine-phosphatase
MKVLFICSANKDRSATAELLAREIWQNHEYDSAGTNQKLCF